MKIIHVTNFFKPSWESGGPARVCYELARMQKEKGNSVSIITTDGYKRRILVDKQPMIVDNLRVYYYKNVSRLLISKFLITTPLINMTSLKEEIKAADIVHIHEGNMLLGPIVARIANRYNKTIIYQPHGSIKNKNYKKFISTMSNKVFLKQILSTSKRIISLSQTESKCLEEIGVDPKKIVILPNGTANSDKQSIENNDTFSLDEKNRRIILYVGRINKTKGLDLLVDSVKILSRQRNDFICVIAGPDDGYLSEMKQLIKYNDIDKYIIFPGYLSENEIHDLYNISTIFITPNYSGFPVTFVEACSYGLPIIVTNNGDKLNWLDEVGLVVDYRPTVIAEAINTLLNNQEMCNMFSSNGKRLVRDQFNWESITNTLEAIYYEVKHRE